MLREAGRREQSSIQPVLSFSFHIFLGVRQRFKKPWRECRWMLCSTVAPELCSQRSSCWDSSSQQSGCPALQWCLQGLCLQTSWSSLHFSLSVQSLDRSHCSHAVRRSLETLPGRPCPPGNKLCFWVVGIEEGSTG